MTEKRKASAMVDAMAKAICHTAHSQVHEHDCFSGKGSADYQRRRRHPCFACREQAAAALRAFFDRVAIVSGHDDATVYIDAAERELLQQLGVLGDVASAG